MQMGRRIGRDSTKAPRNGDAFDSSGVNPGFHVLPRLGDGFNSPEWSAFVLGEHL